MAATLPINSIELKVKREEVALNSTAGSSTSGSVDADTGWHVVGGGFEIDPLRKCQVGKAIVNRDGASFAPVAFAVTVYNVDGGSGTLRIHAVLMRLAQ